LRALPALLAPVLLLAPALLLVIVARAIATISPLALPLLLPLLLLPTLPLSPSAIGAPSWLEASSGLVTALLLLPLPLLLLLTIIYTARPAAACSSASGCRPWWRLALLRLLLLLLLWWWWSAIDMPATPCRVTASATAATAATASSSAGPRAVAPRGRRRRWRLPPVVRGQGRQPPWSQRGQSCCRCSVSYSSPVRVSSASPPPAVLDELRRLRPQPGADWGGGGPQEHQGDQGWQEDDTGGSMASPLSVSVCSQE
jgi:hypothetical protein